MDNNEGFIAAIAPLLVAILLLWSLIGWISLRAGRRSDRPEAADAKDPAE